MFVIEYPHKPSSNCEGPIRTLTVNIPGILIEPFQGSANPKPQALNP